MGLWESCGFRVGVNATVYVLISVVSTVNANNKLILSQIPCPRSVFCANKLGYCHAF